MTILAGDASATSFLIGGFERQLDGAAAKTLILVVLHFGTQAEYDRSILATTFGSCHWTGHNEISIIQ